jgi:hypothetical protein
MPPLHDSYAQGGQDLCAHHTYGHIHVITHAPTQVIDFMAPTRATSALGPGYYDVPLGEQPKAAAPDFAKMSSRAEAVGPFGRRVVEEQGEGDGE